MWTYYGRQHLRKKQHTYPSSCMVKKKKEAESCFFYHIIFNQPVLGEAHAHFLSANSLLIIDVDNSSYK